MKIDTITDLFKFILQEIIFTLQDALHRLNPYKQNKTTLLGHNIIWFTNCNWIEQLVAFGQISEYYNHK